MFDRREHRIRRLKRSTHSTPARAPVTNSDTLAPNLAPNPADDLRYIRDTMERSAAFTAVSGWGQVLLGSSALVAAWLAAAQPSPFAWLRIWLAEGILAVAVALLSCTW